MENFSDYLKEIKIGVDKIKDNNLVFWGSWICEKLFQNTKDIIGDYFDEKEVSLIRQILDYLWLLVDQKETISMEKIDSFLKKLQNIDETNLDQTSFEESEIYELIISLDAILNYCKSGIRGFEYNLSQAIINTVDARLQEEDLDVLSPEGFENELLQHEITIQFKMLDIMQDKRMSSEFMRLFRE